jgi:uncharacterized membrane protein
MKEEKTMAPLQKRALYGLILGIIWAVLLVSLFITKGGASAYSEDPTMRRTLIALLMGGAIAYLLLVSPRIKLLSKKIVIDERDRIILERAPRIQLVAMMMSLAIWSISLTEYYWTAGQLPVIFLYIILMSMLIVNVLAASLGILIGYWRMGSAGEVDTAGES